MPRARAGVPAGAAPAGAPRHALAGKDSDDAFAGRGSDRIRLRSTSVTGSWWTITSAPGKVSAIDTVLTRAERPEWTSSEKSTRRSLVAQDFRVLLLIGDDFGDFVAGARATLAARKALDDANAGMWGVKWIALPNPLYGSWKTAAGQ